MVAPVGLVLAGLVLAGLAGLVAPVGLVLAGLVGLFDLFGLFGSVSALLECGDLAVLTVSDSDIVGC